MKQEASRKTDITRFFLVLPELFRYCTAANDIIILGTADRLGIVTMTADAKAIRAAAAQGVDFLVHLHVSCPLTGN